MIIESSCKVSPLPWDDYGPVIPHLLFFGAACGFGPSGSTAASVGEKSLTHHHLSGLTCLM